MGCSVAKSTAVCPLCGTGMRILIYLSLDLIRRIPRSTGLLLQMHAAAMTVQFSAVSISENGRLGRMGGKNGSAHTQAWSSYGEVHGIVCTVCEYDVDESGITEKIAISITGSLHWYPVPQNRHTGLVLLWRSPRNCGHYVSGQQREVRHETKSKHSLHCWPAPQQTWVRPRVQIQILTPLVPAVSSGLVHCTP